MNGKMAAEIGSDDYLHFDQMMVIEDSRTPSTNAYVTIFNIDGSEAEACGNGTRCVADVMMHEARRDLLRVETRPGVLMCQRAGAEQITVNMGKPKFGWEDIPLAEEFRDTRMIELQVGPIDDPVLHSPSVANMGNPHAIFWVENDVESYGLEKFGPLLENHPIFPERANISLAQVTSREAMTLKVWERGVGLTLACGSAACAAVASSIRKGLTETRVTVSLPGGDLTIEQTATGDILMTGPIEYEAVGMVDLDTLETQMAESGNPFVAEAMGTGDAS